jgi:hypothetical protein
MWTSCTSLMASICPLLFFTFLSFLRKYLRKNKQDPSSEIRTEKAIGESWHRHERVRHWPELGLGANLVGGPELHTVDLGVLIAGGWQSATHHLVLMELRSK